MGMMGYYCLEYLLMRMRMDWHFFKQYRAGC